MEGNPYSSPMTLGSAEPEELRRRAIWRLRAISYVHLVALCLCTIHTLGDTGLIPQMRSIPASVGIVLGPLVFVVMMTWFLCPLVSLVTILRMRVPAGLAFHFLVVEAGLSAVQFLAMLPTVM